MCAVHLVQTKWIRSQTIYVIHACIIQYKSTSSSAGAGVKQGPDWCPFQVVKPRHHFRTLFLLQPWGRCCSLGGLPDCGSHLPQSHLGNFLWGLAVKCNRTASTTDPDLQVKYRSKFKNSVLKVVAVFQTKTHFLILLLYLKAFISFVSGAVSLDPRSTSMFQSSILEM